MKNIYTFKSEKVYSSPTETIDVNLIKTVKSDENTSTNIFVKNKIIYYLHLFCRKLSKKVKFSVFKPKVLKKKKLG